MPHVPSLMRVCIVVQNASRGPLGRDAELTKALLPIILYQFDKLDPANDVLTIVSCEVPACSFPTLSFSHGPGALKPTSQQVR